MVTVVWIGAAGLAVTRRCSKPVARRIIRALEEMGIAYTAKGKLDA